MLSQIESGTATPSVKTLHFLANVLSIPVSELMQEERKDGDYNQLDRLMRAKQYFKLGQYNDLLIQRSIDFAGKGIYSNESLKTEGILQLNRFAGQLSDQFQKKK